MVLGLAKTPCTVALPPVVLDTLPVFSSHHGEGCCCGRGAEAGLGEVHALVLLALFELEELVGSERSRRDAYDEVDVLSEVDLLGEVWEKARS